MTLTKGYKQLLAEANAKIRTLSMEEARARHGSEDVVFVDLRDVRELEREGLVPGAIHAPRGMLEFWVDPESPYYKEVFGSGKELVRTSCIYCSSRDSFYDSTNMQRYCSNICWTLMPMQLSGLDTA